jgi:hypothetical protein
VAGGWPGLDPVYRGVEGWRKFDRDFREAWDSLEVLIDEVHQVDDKVVALANFHARGREGIELRRPIAWVTTFRDGLAIRGDVYNDWNRAREVAGLGSSPVSPPAHRQGTVERTAKKDELPGRKLGDDTPEAEEDE